MHVFEHDVRDKAQTAGVDADHGNAQTRGGARRPEHGAVAADGHGHVALAHDALGAARLKGAVQGHVGGGVFIQTGHAARLRDQITQLAHVAGDVSLRFGNNGNALKL